MQQCNSSHFLVVASSAYFLLIEWAEEIVYLRNELTKSKEKVSELEQSMKNVCMCVFYSNIVLIISVEAESRTSRESRESQC